MLYLSVDQTSNSDHTLGMIPSLMVIGLDDGLIVTQPPDGMVCSIIIHPKEKARL